MAKILYGVHGTGHGHAVRALTLARHFAGSGTNSFSSATAPGAAILRREFPVEDCPNPETPIRGHKVATAATIYSSLSVRSRSRTYIRQILELKERFQPDVTLSDYEYFVPRAARLAGLPCLSVDHQARHHRLPPSGPLGPVSGVSLHRLGSQVRFSAGPATTW